MAIRESLRDGSIESDRDAPMWRRKQYLGLTALLLLPLPWVTTSGCNQSDLGDYRQLGKRPASSEKASPTAAEKTSEATTQPEVASQPAPVVIEDAAVAPATQIAADQAVSALFPVNVVDGASLREVMGALKSDQPPNKAPTATASEPIKDSHTIELLIKEKSFRKEPKTGALRVSFDDLDLLKVLNMEPVVADAETYLPDWLKGLNGKRIRLRGYMIPTFESEGIEHFTLARDNQICCFGRDPKIYDLVQINMKDGSSTNYVHWTRSIDVVGVLTIHLDFEGGKPLGLYTVDQAEVITN